MMMATNMIVVAILNSLLSSITEEVSECSQQTIMASVYINFSKFGELRLYL